MQLICTASRSLHEFQLVDNQKTIEILRYNPRQQTARIAYDGYQRLFFVEQSGFRNNHFRVKNEYGVDIGSLVFEKGNEQHECLMEIEEGKYQCMFHKAENQLAVYRQASFSPLITCNVQLIDWIITEAFTKKEAARREYISLLLGLCWYAHLTAPQSVPALSETLS